MRRRLALTVTIAVFVTTAVGAGAMAADVSTAETPTILGQQDEPTEEPEANETEQNDTDVNETAPGEEVPPADNETLPPTDNETVPPTDNETVPPTDNETVPPADNETLPPTDNETLPPADNETVPPADNETVPPADNETLPPADNETPPPADDEPAPPAADDTATVTVVGTGEASAQPDRAIVYVAATATGENASEAAAALAENASTLRSALEDSNLTDEVRTTDYQLFEQQDVELAANDTGTWMARHAFAVGTNDTNATGDLIDLAVENGATEVQGIAFTLSESSEREVRGTAIDSAVADASDQAGAVADSTQLSLGPIHSVRVDSGGVGPVFVEAADAGTTIDAGDVTVGVRVEITYGANASAGT